MVCRLSRNERSEPNVAKATAKTTATATSTTRDGDRETEGKERKEEVGENPTRKARTASQENKNPTLRI